MFPIYVADRKKMDPKDDICYIVAKNGLFVKKKLGLIESITPVDDIPTLEFDVVPYAKLNLPKIPKKIFCQIFSLFRRVYIMYRSECTVLLFYNQKNRKFKVGVPHQKVSYSGVECVKMGSPEGYVTVASIHSHCNFSAFHSGTDVNDEEYIEGLHITIGDVDEDQFSLVSSIVSNRKRFKIDPLKVIDGIDENTADKNSKYLIVGGFVWTYDPKWLDFITGTEYKPVTGYQYNFGHRGGPFYQVIGKDIKNRIKSWWDDKNYTKYLAEEKEAKKVDENDPCAVCPFRKDKEPEVTVEDLFFGYGE